MINPDTITRAFGALAARRRGERVDDIAMRYGVSRERARQLSQLGFVVERERDSGDPWYELAPRTRNGLVGDGCVPTLDGVAARYPKVSDLWPIPYFGPKSIADLQAWLVRHGRKALPCE